MPKRTKNTDKPVKQPKQAVKDLETPSGKADQVKAGLKYDKK